MPTEETGNAAMLPAGGTTPGANANKLEERPAGSTQEGTGTGNRGQGNSGSSTFRINNFKGEVSAVGAVIGTKSENRTTR